MSEEKKKMTIGQWIENFWYYNKWKMVIGVILVIAIWVGAVYIADNSKENETGDLTLVTVFAGKLTPNAEDFDKRLESVVSDADGDGEKKVIMTPYYISESVSSDNDKVSKAQFESGLGKCYGDMMIFDKVNLDAQIKKDIFEPIGNYVDLSAIPEEDIVYRGDVPVAVKLTQSKMLADMGFIVDEIYVSVVFIPDDADDELLASRENAKGAIAKLLEKSEEPMEEKKEE